MVNAVHKGKRGEKEFCNWLILTFPSHQLLINEQYQEKVERNYNQSQGGADIIVKDFIFEIKRREELDLNSWWYQVSIAAQKHVNQNLIPVVAFRKNGQREWEFLLPAKLINCEHGYLRVSERVFIEFARTILRSE